MERFLFLFVILCDQLLKIYVNSAIGIGSSVTILPKLLALTNVHNFGAAWGSFSGYVFLLCAVSIICIAALVLFYIRFRSDLTNRGKIIVSLIAAGAFGNLIDRLFIGYVRDMLEVLFLDFPVFNIADCAITLGSVLLVIDTVFFDTSSLLSLLESKLKKKERGKDDNTF